MMPNPKKESLAATIADLQSENGELRGAINLLQEEKRLAKRGMEESENRVAEAKRMIADLHEKVAELNGYVRRTHEIDDARSELVPEPRPMKMVPRSGIARNGHDMNFPGEWPSVADESFGRRSPPKHWTAL